jgi:hypothetical protein
MQERGDIRTDAQHGADVAQQKSTGKTMNSMIYDAHRFSIAPMMDWTDIV